MDHIDNANQAILRLTEALNKIDGAYYFCAKHMGVKENTLALLFALDDGKAHSQTQISREWLIPKTTVNTVVKELAGEGYIKLVGTEHSREKNIILTDRGRAFADEIMKEIKQAERQALEQTLSCYSPEFIDAIELFASRLRDAFVQRQLL
mgnify:CR=1 FL=1